MNQTHFVSLMIQHILLVMVSLLKRILDKILKDRAHKIDRNHTYDGHQRALASMIYQNFDKKIRSIIAVNEKLAEDLHKAVIKKFKR